MSKTKRSVLPLQHARDRSDDVQYVWPELSTADAFIGKGMNTFRINILAERGVKGKDQKGPFNEPYIEDLKKARLTDHFL